MNRNGSPGVMSVTRPRSHPRAHQATLEVDDDRIVGFDWPVGNSGGQDGQAFLRARLVGEDVNQEGPTEVVPAGGGFGGAGEPGGTPPVDLFVDLPAGSMPAREQLYTVVLELWVPTTTGEGFIDNHTFTVRSLPTGPMIVSVGDPTISVIGVG